MKKLSKMFLIAFVLANSGCKNKCSDYDLASPYKTLSINYQKKNLNRPYFPSLSRDYILPNELINLKITDEDKKDYKISFPLRNDVYQVQIDSYLSSFKLVEIQPLKKTFFIQFKNGDSDTLKTETVFKKDDCGNLIVQEFIANYKQQLLKPIDYNFPDVISITIEK